jgi:hypothetical protein
MKKLHTTAKQRKRLGPNTHDKQVLIQDHFESIMTDPPPRTCDFSWAHFQLPTPDLSSLDSPFTDEEIWQAIHQLPQTRPLGQTALLVSSFVSVGRPFAWTSLQQ